MFALRSDILESQRRFSRDTQEIEGILADLVAEHRRQKPREELEDNVITCQRRGSIGTEPWHCTGSAQLGAGTHVPLDRESDNKVGEMRERHKHQDDQGPSESEAYIDFRTTGK